MMTHWEWFDEITEEWIDVDTADAAALFAVGYIVRLI